jgi:hypothetical protein
MAANAELQATGEIDSGFVSAVGVTSWLKKLVKVAPATIDTALVSPTGQAVLNTTGNIFAFPRKLDVLFGIRVQVTLPGLVPTQLDVGATTTYAYELTARSDVTTASAYADDAALKAGYGRSAMAGSWVRWVNSVGHAMFTEIRFIVSGSAVTKLTSDIMNCIECTVGKQGLKGMDMIGKFDNMMQAILWSSAPRRLYVDVPLWFTEDISVALILAALMLNTLTLELDTRAITDLIKVSNPDIGVVERGNNAALSNTSLTFKVVFRGAQVSVNERKIYMNHGVATDVLMKDYQVQSFSSSDFGTNSVIKFVGPIAAILWTTQLQGNIVSKNWFDYTSYGSSQGTYAASAYSAYGETTPSLLPMAKLTSGHFIQSSTLNSYSSAALTDGNTQIAGAWAQRGIDIDGEEAGDLFGFGQISSDGSVFASGSYQDIGYVQIYAWSGTAWIQRGLTISGNVAGEKFGFGISLSGDGSVVAMGAPESDVGGTNSGYVQIYAWDGTAWIQRGTNIVAEAAGDECGCFVDLSRDGSVVVIGAKENDGSFSGAGQVRVYAWDGAAWNQRGIDIDGDAAGDKFGFRVAISSDGSIIACCSPANTGGAGQVKVYTWDGAAWNQRGLDIYGDAANDQAGVGVVLSSDGSVLAIGSSGHVTSTGRVRVYAWNGAAWIQRGANIDGETVANLFGLYLDISSDGTVLAVGAPSGNYVKIYVWNGTTWNLRGLKITGEAAGDFSGVGVSLSSDGSILMIGAVLNDGNGASSGHARVYKWMTNSQLPEGSFDTSIISASPDMFADFAWEANSGVLQQSMSSDYYRTCSYLDHGYPAPTDPIYMITFALDPFGNDYSGSNTMSCTDILALKGNVTAALDSGRSVGPYVMRVHGIGRNFFSYNGSNGTKVYM